MSGTATDDGRAFAIAGELLADDADGWRNLGLWPAPDYASACAALAREAGRAIALDSRDRVLELACGQGAGLALWQREFAVHELAGIDLQAEGLAAARARVPGATLVQARFDRLPPPPALTAQAWNVVLCIDAAYHADSPAAFLDFAAAMLTPDGRLAFTTLLRGPGGDAQPRSAGLLRFLLRLARVPVVADEGEWRAHLARAGYTDVRLRGFDAAVLSGFADYIAQRGRQLPLCARLRPAWLKIRLTAALCRLAHRHQLLHYALVLARRNPTTSPRSPA